MVVFLKTFGKTVEAFGVGFLGVGEFFEALVNFDARDDAPAGKEIDKILAVVGLLTGSFVKKDNAVDVFFEVWSGKENIAIVAAVVVGISDV